MAAGDTQPMSSQVTRDYLSAYSKAIPSGPGTYATDDTGYVDFAAGLGPEVHAGEQIDMHGSPVQSEPESDAGVDRDNDAVSRDEEDELQRGLSSPPFNAITPLAGKKHDRHGAIVDERDDVNTTEGLAAMFGASNAHPPTMAMTQLFHNTQAGSSSPPPSPGFVRSDPIFARPSPNMRNTSRTPGVPTSSPPTTRKLAPFRSFAEPRETYIPLHEAQHHTRGSKEYQEEASPDEMSADDDEDISEDDLGQREGERRRRRQLIERRARSQLHDFTAQTPANPGRRRKMLAAKTTIGLVTPYDKRMPSLQPKEVITISSDSKTPRRHPSEDDQDDVSVDEYDELSQVVVSSSRNPLKEEMSAHRHSNALTTTDQRPNSSPVAGKYGGKHGGRPNYAAQAWERGGLRKLAEDAASPNQPDDVSAVPQACVENSQPEGSLATARVLQRPLMPSSITSRGFVSQSQLPLMSSLQRDTDSVPVLPAQSLQTSSIPPAPPLPDSSPSPRRRSAQHTTPASSPPLMHPGLGSQIGSRRPSTAMSDQSKENRAPRDQESTTEQRHSRLKVPETSPMASAQRQEDTNEFVGPTRDVQGDSENARARLASDVALSGKVRSEQDEVFKTAPSTLRMQSSVATPKSSSRQHSSTTPGSIHRPGMLKMVDIAGSQNETALSDPLNLPDFSILNDNDREYQNAMSVPSPSGRRTKGGRITYGKKPSRRRSTGSRSKIFDSEAVVQETTSTVLSYHNSKDEHAEGLSSTLPNAPSQGSKAGGNDQHMITMRLPITVNSNEPFMVTKDGFGEVGEAEHHRQDTMQPQHREAALSLGRYQVPNADDNVASPPASKPADLRLSESNLNERDAAERRAFPNRVFAIFKGSPSAYYPATCIRRSPNSSTALVVRFDDGTEDAVESHLVKRLELREGDQVKADIPGKKHITFIVQGLLRETNAPERAICEGHGKDAFGNTTATLIPKQGRASLPATTTSSDRINIDIESVYITPTMWPKLKDRAYNPTLSVGASRVQTPSERLRTPSTPSSRTRRSVIAQEFFEDDQAAMSSSEHTSGVFSNMVFCVSYSSDKEDEKTSVVEDIRAHGGRILAEGFHQLFEHPKTVSITPSTSVEPGTSGLELSAFAQQLGLAAVIADCHTRRTKYIQALALNLPCLHGRWIIDSSHSGALLPLTRYLLPAGECAFLGGAIRSRVIEGPFGRLETQPSSVTLSQLVEHRSKPFAGKKIMLIIGSGKLGATRSAHTFLTYVAGAEKVKRAKDIPAAKVLLQDDGDWDYIFVEDTRVKETESKLFGEIESRQDVEKGSKRRRTGTRAVRDLHRPRVLGDKMAVQAFILGSWHEE